MSADMTIGVIGAGGVGGYYAGLLARAGHPVHLLARGHHLQAIRDGGGLRVRTPEAEFVAVLTATDDVSALEGLDVVLVAVKSYSLAEVMPVVAAAARSGALVLPLLNGVDVVDRLEEGGVPRERLLGGLTYISASRVAPGRVERTSPFQRVRVGEPDGGPSQRAARVAAAFAGSGADAAAVDDIALEIWRKFVFLSPMSTACGLSRTAIGAIRATPHGRLLLRRLVEETAAVARARNVPLADDEVDRTLDMLHNVPAGMRPSFLLDLERDGPNELDALCGAVVRLGADALVPTPVHDLAFGALQAAGTR